MEKRPLEVKIDAWLPQLPFSDMSMIKLRLSFLLILVFLVPGCSDPTKGEVSGTVKVNGEPAKQGAITFIPVDGKSSTAGAKITDGQFMAPDVPVGTVKVQIRVSKIVGQTRIYNTPDSPIQDIMEEVLPPKYNDQTELLLDVKSGKNEQDFDLTAK